MFSFPEFSGLAEGNSPKKLVSWKACYVSEGATFRYPLLAGAGIGRITKNVKVWYSSSVFVPELLQCAPAVMAPCFVMVI